MLKGDYDETKHPPDSLYLPILDLYVIPSIERRAHCLI